MTIPGIFFGFILSSIYGTIFHLIKGGSGGRLLLFLFLSWLGFWAGQYLANRISWTFGTLGPLHLGLASIGSILFIIGGNWLSQIETSDE